MADRERECLEETLKWEGGYSVRPERLSFARVSTTAA